MMLRYTIESIAMLDVPNGNGGVSRRFAIATVQDWATGGYYRIEGKDHEAVGRLVGYANRGDDHVLTRIAADDRVNDLHGAELKIGELERELGVERRARAAAEDELTRSHRDLERLSAECERWRRVAQDHAERMKAADEVLRGAN